MIIVDGHEDLAWNMESFGRDYARSVAETRALEEGSATVEHNGQALLGWPDWIEGQVGLIFGSIYAAPAHWREGPWDRVTYRDSEEAHRRYWHQLDLYDRLFEEHADKFCRIRTRGELREHLERWERAPESRRVGVVLLMEGAEGVRAPSELEAWFERGVRIVGPAWDRTRYAGSGYEEGPLTDLGWELLEGMADLGMILDLSHLSPEGCAEALERYPGRIIASHANPLQLIPNTLYPRRHLSRGVICRLIERGGVQGIVLANKFLRDGWRPGDRRQLVNLEHVVAHIDSVCQLAGDADHVALGSDFDGGFGLAGAPLGLESIADLGRIGQELRRHGYEKDDMLKILGGNWIRILDGTLPTA